MFSLGQKGMLRADSQLFYWKASLSKEEFWKTGFSMSSLAPFTRNCGIMVKVSLVCEVGHKCLRDREVPLLVSQRGEKSLDMLNITNQTSVFGTRAYLEFYTGIRTN
jgi:hypothetical protein